MPDKTDQWKARAEMARVELCAYLETRFKHAQPNSDCTTEEWALSALINASSIIDDALGSSQRVLVLAGWQVRWLDPEEGPGSWRCCDNKEYIMRKASKRYEVREVFAEE